MFMVEIRGLITKISGKNITITVNGNPATLPASEKWIIDVALDFMYNAIYVVINVQDGEIFDLNKYDPYDVKEIADKAVGDKHE